VNTSRTGDPISHPLDRFAVKGKSAIIAGASVALAAGVAKTLGAMGVKLALD